MNKILVTGASGFIGMALTERLKALGHDVKTLYSRNGDIADRNTFEKFERGSVEHVFHLAGKTFVPDSWENPQLFCHTNVLGTVNVMEFCRKHQIPITFVSAYVYGHPDSLPISENNAICPSNPYALSKRLAEEVCEFYARAYNLPVTVIRPFNVYGIGQSESFLIPVIVSQALDKGEEIIVKDLAPKRDYIYLEDLVMALLATLKEPNGYRVYNIGSGASLSVQEVINVVQDVLGTNKKVVCANLARSNELMDVVADISKAENELGWHPYFSFHEGIENLIRYEREMRSK